jgi:hypothetical protein
MTDQSLRVNDRNICVIYLNLLTALPHFIVNGTTLVPNSIYCRETDLMSLINE